MKESNTYRYAPCAFYVPLPSFLREGDILRGVVGRTQYPTSTPQAGVWGMETLTTR